MNSQDFTNPHFDEDSIDIKKELSYYAYFWPYFLVTVFIALFGSYLFLRYADRVYSTSAQIQIKKKDSDDASFLTQNADALFNFDKVNVENDIAVITSNRLLRKVGQRLNLQTTVISKGKIASTLQFNGDIPFSINFGPDLFFDDYSIEVSNRVARFNYGERLYDLEYGVPLSIEGITITLKETLFTKDAVFEISRTTLNNSVANLKAALEVTAASKQGEVVNLMFKGTNKTRNEAILNTLIEVSKKIKSPINVKFQR